MTQCLSSSLGVQVSQFSCLHILTHSAHALKHTLETLTRTHAHVHTNPHQLSHTHTLTYHQSPPTYPSKTGTLTAQEKHNL